jgi:hypothetical protein
MPEPIDIVPRLQHDEAASDDERRVAARVASNPVYARVGEAVFRTAIEGVRRGTQPDDIIRGIVREHNVRMTVGELRLLLATRRTPEDRPNRQPASSGLSATLEAVGHTERDPK